MEVQSSRKWAVDFIDRSPARNQKDAMEPYGFVDRPAQDVLVPHQQKDKNIELKTKKAWEVAKSPSKSIFMSVFMAWMSGNSVNIFSIMITLYSFINPLKAIFSTNAAFAKYEEAQINLVSQKMLYILINLVTVSIAVYKCYVLGLLPVTVSDWVHLLDVKTPMEFS